ncbi:MAG: SH3 domain-containing protein [Chloroflexota bacterium]
MLFATIGALWVISFICMMFLGAYTYRLTKEHLHQEASAYLWTVARVITLLFASLSVFYFGVSRQIERLPKLLVYQLSINDIPLWSTADWVLLSSLFGILGVLIAVCDTLWTDWNIGPKPQIQKLVGNLPQLSLKMPYIQSTTAPPVGQNSVGQNNELGPQASPFARQEHMWGLANSLIGLFAGCFLFVSLQTVSQINLVQALGGDESTVGLTSIQRIRPTPPSISYNSENSEALLTPASETEEQGGDLTTPSDSVPRESMARSIDGSNSPDGGTSGQENEAIATAIASVIGEEQANLNQADEGEVNLNQVAAETDSLPLPASETANEAETSISEATAQAIPVVLIQEPLGVNARSGPGTSFDVLTVLELGTIVEILGRSDSGEWIQVQLPGRATGWVASWVVVVTEQ